MILKLEVWLIPAIAAGSASYLVSLLWERFRPRGALSRSQEAFIALLSFAMGAVGAVYREEVYSRSLENNTIAMFVAGAVATQAWLWLRRRR